MVKLFDRVKVNIATTGVGDITFGSAASDAFLTPTEAGCADADEVRYVIVDGTDYEEGIGTIKSSVAEMERTTVTKSKIGGNAGTTKINLSGTAVLALIASAADILTPWDNLSSLDDADEALDNLGGTTVGKAVFLASDDAAARAAIGVSVGIPDVIVEDRKSQGTAGGAASAGIQARVLNTLVRNAGSIASLSSNVVTLPAGTYYFQWSAPAYFVAQHQSLLFNVTDSTYVGFGSSEYSSAIASDSACTRSMGSAIVTIAGSKDFSVRHFTNTAKTTNGLGVQSNVTSSVSEVYTRLEITKLS